MTQTIIGSIIAGLIVLALVWIVPRTVGPAWSWTSSKVKAVWVNVVNDAVKPLRSEIKGDIREIKRSITRIDGVLSSLQLRVDDQPDLRAGSAADSSEHTEQAESESGQNKQIDKPEEAEHDDG